MADKLKVYIKAWAVCAECGRDVVVQKQWPHEKSDMLKVRCSRCGKIYEIENRLAPYLWTTT